MFAVRETPAACRPHEDDDALFERWRADRDSSSRDALVDRYLPLARKLALRYMHSSEPLDDLVQVANLGLVKALERYEPGPSRRFAAFAVPTILGELRRYFRDCGWTVHVPRGAQERVLQVERAGRELTAQHGRAPTVAQIAEYTELDVEVVLDAMQAAYAYQPGSLDAPGQGVEGELDPLVETLGGDEPGFALVVDAATVSTGLALLSAREREILRLRFAEELTQSEIANRFGVSQMQISRTLRDLLARLRQLAEDDPAAAAAQR